MDHSLLTSYEASVRLAAYILVLATMLVWEHKAAIRLTEDNKFWRWLNNISLAWIGGLLVRLLLPATAVGIATQAQEADLGLLRQTPFWLNIALSIIMLDLIIYWQHRLFHRIPWLWRLHSTHHLDSSLDASTGARFHPIEILVSMLVKIAAIAILGCSPLAVLSFEILLNASATFNHSNINIPPKLQRVLMPWLVTPIMHSVHHSIKPTEAHSNFGFFLCLWDKLFKSYCSLSNEEQKIMIIGLPQKRWKGYKQDIFSLLLFPFRYKP